MSRGLAESIAVLDGLDGNVINAYNQINASNGANYSGGSSYPEQNAIPLMTSSIGLAGSDSDVINAYNQINASNGANYSGGSNYPEQNAIPLMTSSIGLAGTDHDVVNMYNVINASNGGNYSGGSSYPEENPIPLMTSSVGLAGAMRGFADGDLLAYANGVGQIPDTLPGRMNVLDASGGANYSGGSSYAPGLPLLPSSAGLAGVSSMIYGKLPPKAKLAYLQARIREANQAQEKALRLGRRSDADRFLKMVVAFQKKILALYKIYPEISPWGRSMAARTQVRATKVAVDPWR